MDLLFYIVLSAALVAGIVTPAQVGPAGVRAGRLRKRALTKSSPLSGFRTGESGAYGGEGGRMIAAISIGIIIIIAVIIAALAIIYFILKGSPR
jgi:ABC-type multidrug transport system permease subunit